MAKRYEVMKHIQQGYWIDNAPLLLSAHALIKDTVSDAVCAQCKLTNLCHLEINAVYISVSCIGADGNPVEGVKKYVYLDLKTRAGEFLGDDKLIPLPDKTTRQFTVALDKVVFSDGSVWQANVQNTFSALSNHLPLSKLAHLEEQYRRIAPEELQANLPERHATYWRCGCGQINLTETAYCVKCEYDLKSQLATIDTDTLEAQLAEYITQERQKKECAGENASILKKQEQQLPKKKRITLISASVITAVFIVLFIVFNTVIIPSSNYSKAENFLIEGKYSEAYFILEELGDYKNSRELMNNSLELLRNSLPVNTISNGFAHTVVLKTDGTVVAFGNNHDGQHDTQDWRNIIAIAAGNSHTVGLRTNGTVVAVGSNKNGQCNVSSWTDIVAISAGDFYTVGVKSDGTLIVTGSFSGDISNLSDIVAVSAESFHIIGLRADGTVIGVGSDRAGVSKVSTWSDIISISTNDEHTVGLKADGTVVAVGSWTDGKLQVSSWSNIVAISAGTNHTVGLRSNGTVVAIGSNEYGQCDVSGWSDIIAISANYLDTYAVKSDGTVFVTKKDATPSTNTIINNNDTLRDDEFWCMGKNDTCKNKTSSAYQFYCRTCDPNGDNIEG